MNEAEIRELSNQDLADLDLAVRGERDRRNRLSSACADITALLKGVRSDGGDPDQVVADARAAANEAAPDEV